MGHNELHSLFKNLKCNQMIKLENGRGSRFGFNFLQAEGSQLYAPSNYSARPKAFQGTGTWSPGLQTMFTEQGGRRLWRRSCWEL